MQQWKYREFKGKEGKFRVGDSVRLSSYGRSTEQNNNDFFDGDEIGLIKKICHGNDKYPIEVQWVNIPNKGVATRFYFRELKRVRT